MVPPAGLQLTRRRKFKLTAGGVKVVLLVDITGHCGNSEATPVDWPIVLGEVAAETGAELRRNIDQMNFGLVRKLCGRSRGARPQLRADQPQDVATSCGRIRPRSQLSSMMVAAAAMPAATMPAAAATATAMAAAATIAPAAGMAAAPTMAAAAGMAAAAMAVGMRGRSM